MLPTPKTDFWEENESFNIKGVQVTIGNEISSKYINVLHCREIEREYEQLWIDSKNLRHEYEETNKKLKIALEQWQLCLEEITKITNK